MYLVPQSGNALPELALLVASERCDVMSIIKANLVQTFVWIKLLAPSTPAVGEAEFCPRIPRISNG